MGDRDAAEAVRRLRRTIQNIVIGVALLAFALLVLYLGAVAVSTSPGS